MKKIFSNGMNESLTLTNFARIVSDFIKTVSELQKSSVFLNRVTESVVCEKTFLSIVGGKLFGKVVSCK